MRKLFKAVLIIIILALIACAAAFAVYAFITKDAVLDENKLTDYSRSITVCDVNGKEITSASLNAKRKSVRLENLNDYTINAFIASEDRNFYKHNGLNYKRMLKAVAANLSSRSFSQGASTISQQLIKNTHLTGDKTIKRKLNEIKLTRKLEKKYSKNEILEMYLNTIYFGHNCYGLESAAEFYFGTTADKLDLGQSAALAGLLTSPNNFSPYKNPEKCIRRRNTVLKCMQECGYLTESEYNQATALPLETSDCISEGNGSGYLYGVFEELEDINFDFFDLTDECRIITYMDSELQKFVDSLSVESDCAVVVTSQEGGVRAYRSDIGGAKRQPGSTIKPLLVYGPAIEEKLICPATKILDEKLNYGGYSPENHDKKYHGYITATECLAKSYNVPAVKILNSLTLDKAEKYALKMGIKLEDGEKNLALALGGMNHGLSLEELCEKYRAFAGGGAYSNTKYIKEIILKNGKVIYRAKDYYTPVFSRGTASLMNEMLSEAAKSGTAKKLKNLDFDVAAKTGTCGTEKGNTDAYCMAYTCSDCVGVWLGSKDNKPLQISGGGDCCNIAKNILEIMYKNNRPPQMDKTSGTTSVNIDREKYSEDNKIILADDIAPKLSVTSIRVKDDAVPKEKSTSFSNPEIKKPLIKAENNTVLIQLCQTKYYAYLIKRQNNGTETVIYDGEWKENICDDVESGKYTYTVTPYYSDGKIIHKGQTITLPEINVSGTDSPQKNTPDITKKDWTKD